MTPLLPTSTRAMLVRVLGTTIAAGGFLSLGACGGDAAAPGAALDPDRAYWSVTLNHRAVLMAATQPYDTLRLIATPLNARGAPLSPAARDSVVTTYTLADPTDTNVTVSPTGLIRARHPDPFAVIRVRTTAQGVTRSDSVLLSVMSGPVQQFARLDLSITPTDTIYDDFSRPPAVLSARALDVNGDSIPGVLFAFGAADSTVALPYPQGPDAGHRGVHVGPRAPGRTTVYATATVYGVTRADSVSVTATWPFSATIDARFVTPKGVPTSVGYFTPTLDTIAAGATVMWSNQEVPGSTPPPIDIVFDDSSAARPASTLFAQYCFPSGTGSGNIPAFAPDTTEPLCHNQFRFRKFSKPGTYHYSSRQYGTGGTIVVMP